MNNRSNKQISVVNRLPLYASLMVLFMFSVSGFSQEKMEIAPEEFSSGITLQFSGRELVDFGDFLMVSDSSGHELAMLNVMLNGEKRWARVSKDAPEPENVVHWYFDGAAGQLVVDLRGIRNDISPQSALVVSVSVLNTRIRHFKLTAYNAAKQADDQLNVLSKIKDVDVDVQ